MTHHLKKMLGHYSISHVSNTTNES